jgi:tetratricopeptide (TPR) repeat protein
MGRKRLPPDDPREWLNRARSNLACARAEIAEAYLEDLCDPFSNPEGSTKAGRQMSELPHDLDEQIRLLLVEGDELLDEDRIEEAMSRYRAAWELLPEPRTDRPLALDVLAAMGDLHFFREDFAAGLDAFMTAMKCSLGDPVGNPFLRLRLGQCMYEMGERREAANWLAGAYLLEGTELFAHDDPKYLEFIKSQLEPPPAGWPEGW